MPKSDYTYCVCGNMDCYSKYYGEDGLVRLSLYFWDGGCCYTVSIVGSDFSRESSFRERFEFEDLEKMTHGAVEQMLEDFCESVLGGHVSIERY